MRKLSEAEEGKYYQVTWLAGKLAEEIGRFMHLNQDDVVYVDHNFGNGGMVVSAHGRQICMNRASADTIRVEPAIAWRIA